MAGLAVDAWGPGWPFRLSIFTPTEAGAVGSSLSVLIAVIKRSLTWDGLRSSVVDTLKNSAALFIIAIGASLLTRFMAYSGAGDAMAKRD